MSEFPILFTKFQQEQHILSRRKHFRFLVREQIKELTQEEFQNLCSSCLHDSHYPLFQEWFKATQMMVLYLSNPKSKKADIKYWTYLSGSHRKTLTVRLTELGETGYTPEVLEWFILNRIWNPMLEERKTSTKN